MPHSDFSFGWLFVWCLVGAAFWIVAAWLVMHVWIAFLEAIVTILSLIAGV